MFEADGGNEIVHIMDRVMGTILARLRRARAAGRPVHVPALVSRTRRAISTPARRSTAAGCRSSVAVDCDDDGNGKGTEATSCR
jgi:hypothetical protein